MRKIFLAFGFHILVFGICFAQSGWKWLNPYPTGMHLNYVKFINNNTGVIVGNGGTILRTTNSGDSWNLIECNITNSLLSVSFANQTNGITVGEDGLIFKTTNAGLNWYRAYDSTFYSTFIKNVSYVDNETVYTNDYNTYVKKSTNGGVNWVALPSNIPLCSFFLNSSTGYTARSDNNGGDIEITTNGGLNWTRQTSPNSYHQSPYFIRFTNSNLGIITFWYGLIYYTNNGGINWYNRSYPTQYQYDIFSGQMLDSNLGYVTTDSGKILKTYNAGINWLTQSTGTIEQFNSLDFINANTGVVVGNSGTIARTTNGGNSWSFKSGGFTDDIKCVYFINASTGFIAGANSKVLKTTNGGINWSQINTGYNINFFGLKFNNLNTGFLVGDAGNILRTTNSGSVWTQCNSSSSYWLTDIDFLDNLNGYAVGSKETILKTTNSGLNWTVVFNTTSNYQNFRVKCITQNIAYATGRYIYKTTNSGINWNIVSPSSTYNMEYWDMSFMNENTGYVTALNVSSGLSNVLKTTNGGINWITQYSNFPEYNAFQFLSISMINQNTGYTCGDKSYVFKTTNGGTNWNIEYKSKEPFYFYNTITRFNRVFSVDTGNIYIVGNHGMVLRKGNGNSIGIKEYSKPVESRNFILCQNYPNPFNPVTSIKYQLPSNVKSETSNVKLVVYDILGKEVATLVNEKQSPGVYGVTFDGSQYPSGVYFYKLETGNYKETKKMLIIK